MNFDVTIGKVRIVYDHLLKPMKPKNANFKERYSASFLIPKENKEQVDEIVKAINAATQDGINQLWKNLPSGLHTPLIDADNGRPSDGSSYPEEFHGHWLLQGASSIDYPPELVDKDFMPLDASELYSGCYGYVSVSFYAYSVGVNKGVGCSINSFMKTEDGEKMGGGRPTAKEAFKNIKK